MVLVIFLYIKVDAAIALIGIAIDKNLFHQFFLFDDMTRSLWLNRWWQHIQLLHRLMVAIGIMLCNLHGLKLFQSRLLLYLVVSLIGIVL